MLHWTLLPFLLVVSPPGWTAQQPRDEVIRATSRLVQVNVIVKDKHGSPVRDLTNEDFSLTDNGSPQKIAVFMAEAAEPHTLSTPAQSATNPLTLQNRKLQPSQSSMPVTVLLFDALNTQTLDDFLYGKRELVKFLRTLAPGAPVAFYSLNGPNVRVIHDFTGNSLSLIQAAQRLSGFSALHGLPPVPANAAVGVSSPVNPFAQMSQWLAEGSRADEASFLRLKTEWTLAALETVAQHLSGIPGRKNFIWISGSFPINIGLDNGSFQEAAQPGVNYDLISFSDREKRLGRLFADAQVAVYPIDPAGLGTDQVYRAAKQIAGQQNPHMITVGDLAEPRIETMKLIARQTGGLAFYNANDLVGSLQRAMDDARVTYTLGFYPPEAAWDGKYHKLNIRVNRNGVVVRSRDGYDASTAAAPLPAAREQALQLAAASPLEGEAIGVKVNLQSNPLDWWGQEFVVSIDPHDLRFENRDGRMHCEVDLVFAQLTSDGRLLYGEKKTLTYNLLPGSFDAASSQGLFFDEQLTVQPGAARVRVIVRDPATGAVGSVSIPVRTAKQIKHDR